MAVEFAPRVRVNVVSPGAIDTDALRHFPERDQLLDGALERTPMRRLATPSDVAAAVDFLTSERAAAITGHTLVVDGGASLPA